MKVFNKFYSELYFDDSRLLSCNNFQRWLILSVCNGMMYSVIIVLLLERLVGLLHGGGQSASFLAGRSDRRSFVSPRDWGGGGGVSQLSGLLIVCLSILLCSEEVVDASSDYVLCRSSTSSQSVSIRLGIRE